MLNEQYIAWKEGGGAYTACMNWLVWVSNAILEAGVKLTSSLYTYISGTMILMILLYARAIYKPTDLTSLSQSFEDEFWAQTLTLWNCTTDWHCLQP